MTHKGRNMHLENITAEAMEEWRNETYSLFASSSGPNGQLGLGITGMGLWCVIYNNQRFFYKTAQEAIDSYAELFT